MPVPIQNIYYLLCYAWEKPEFEGFNNNVTSELTSLPLDLLASMLVTEVSYLVSRGLASDYISKQKAVSGIKGKLLINTTLKEGLISEGKTFCVIEEQTVDIIPNRVIKTTLTKLMQLPGLSPAIIGKLKIILPFFSLVSNIQVNPLPEINLPQYQSARYKYIVNCCTFILESLLPVMEGKEYYFKTLLQNKKLMGKIFEAFVRNFYRREQVEYKVKSEKIDWQEQGATPEAKCLLPAMFTDTSLVSATRTIIIETKFYKKALVPHYNKERLISKHLYQLFAYLSNFSAQKKVAPEGILLYPVVTQELDLKYNLNNFDIRICTINLNQPWINIKQDLLKLIAAP